MKQQKIKITRNDLLREIANNTIYSRVVVEDIYREFEKVLTEKIGLARDGVPVRINLFDGLSVHCDYIPARDVKNNFDGGVTHVAGRIKPRAIFSRFFKGKFLDSDQ